MSPAECHASGSSGRFLVRSQMAVLDALSLGENILEVTFQSLNITKGFRTVLKPKEKKNKKTLS